MTRGEIWSEIKLNKYDLCRGKKQTLNDSMDLYLIKIQLGPFFSCFPYYC